MAVVLAAGKGTRMRSELPKVMHRLVGMPMIANVLSTLKSLSPQKTVVVVAPHMESVKEAARKEMPSCLFASQSEQLGTGHAVKMAESHYANFDGTVLVLYGDTPLITTATLSHLLTEKKKHNAAIALLGMKPESPMGYGRLLMKKEPFVERIIECKDANTEEKKIPWVWGGVMAFDAKFLHEALEVLEKSPITGEYYLTTLVEMAAAKSLTTVNVPVTVEETMGVNDRVQLAEAEKLLQDKMRKKAMEEGATLIDPSSVYFSADTKLGQDVTVHPHVVFGAGVTVENGVEIKSFSHIEGATIKKKAVVGPFARLRPGTVIGEEAHVGNFVELKQTKLGKGAKANHLSYIGDSVVGADANIGAGTITCNYDGFNKYQTDIGEGAFIGSNTALVAPVKVGSYAIIGAGSVITKDVEEGALAVTRPEQVNKSGKAKEIRQRKKKSA